MTLPDPQPLSLARQVFTGADFHPDSRGVATLQVTIPSPSPDERLALLILNVDGPDPGTATVTVSGTTDPSLAAASLWLAEGPPEGSPDADLWMAREAVRQHNQAAIERFLSSGGGTMAREPRWVAPLAAGGPPDPAIFCVASVTGPAVPRTARLQRETPHALFYADEQDLPSYAAYQSADLPGGTIWDRLADAWETRIYPSDTALFGQPSDVDGNGKLIILFSSAVDDPGVQGVLLGYYLADDVVWPADSRACDGTGSNGADLFYLNSLDRLAGRVGSADFVVNLLYPSTLAHEFQHLINFNRHCLQRPCTAYEDTWVNEGLSMVAEDQAGYGWHPVDYLTFDGLAVRETDVKAARGYLTRTANLGLTYGWSGYRGYDGVSLTRWQLPVGDPVGNYQGAHAWFRYFADRLGPGFLEQLSAGDLTGVANFERAAGLPFSQALADFGMAMMFSNEDFSAGTGPLDFSHSPLFDLTGNDWTPFHSKLRHLDYQSLPAATPVTLSLRRDGWSALLTGPLAGSADSVSITVTRGTVTPWVTAVRFTGTLPR